MCSRVNLLLTAMRDRANLLLAALALIALGGTLGGLAAKLGVWPASGEVLDAIAGMAIWSLLVGLVVQRTTRAAAAQHPAVAVAKAWLPDVVGIDLSEDLALEMKADRRAILGAVAALRTRNAIDAPIVHIRDDSLLAARRYAISINGIRIFGATLNGSEDFQTHLLAALEDVWSRHADAIRFFADLRAQAA